MFGQYVNTMMQNLLGDGMPPNWVQSIGKVLGQCNAPLDHFGRVTLPNQVLPNLPLVTAAGAPDGTRGTVLEGQLQGDLTRPSIEPVEVELWDGKPGYERPTGKRVKVWASLMLEEGKTIPAGTMVKLDLVGRLDGLECYWKVTGAGQCGG